MNKKKIKNKLRNSALFITAFELLSNILIENLKGFLSNNNIKLDEVEGFKFVISKEYKDEILNKKHIELNNQKNEFYSCCLWYLEENIIDQVEFNKIQEIRKYRNSLSHNFVNILLDDNVEIKSHLFKDLKFVIDKIGNYWFRMNTQICHPEYDNLNIKVNTPTELLIEYLEDLIKQE